MFASSPPILTVPSPSWDHELGLSHNLAAAIFGLIITGLLVNKIPSFWFISGSAGPSIPPTWCYACLPLSAGYKDAAGGTDEHRRGDRGASPVRRRGEEVPARSPQIRSPLSGPGLGGRLGGLLMPARTAHLLASACR